MKKLNKRWMALGILALALAGGGVRAATELGPNGETPDAAAEEGGLLGVLYKDEVACIAIAPPMGARIITRGGLENSQLFSFIHNDKKWGGSVQSFTVTKVMDIPGYIKESITQLGKDFKGVTVADKKEGLTFCKLPAGRLSTTLETEVAVGAAVKGVKPQTQRVALFRQDLIVKQGDVQFMLLTMYTPLKDKAEAERTFEAMLKTFVIMDKRQVAEKRHAAVELGRKWLSERTAEELKGKLIGTPQMFQVKIGGNPTGYVRFDEIETDRDGSKGILVVVSLRIWPPDGTTLSSKNTAYWRYSRDEKAPRQGYAAWENATKVLAKLTATELKMVADKAAKGERDPNVIEGNYVYWFKETGVLMEEGNTRLDDATLESLKKDRLELIKRLGLTPSQLPPEIAPVQKIGHLIVACSGDATQGFTEANKGLDVRIPADRPAVLPKALEYLWPRVVDLSKPSEMTFWVYNSTTRKLANRTMTVYGPARVSVDGKMVDAIKCADEMDNVGTTFWVDQSGKILKMVTSDQSMLEPTTEEKMTKLWANKVK